MNTNIVNQGSPSFESRYSKTVNLQRNISNREETYDYFLPLVHKWKENRSLNIQLFYRNSTSYTKLHGKLFAIFFSNLPLFVLESFFSENSFLAKFWVFWIKTWKINPKILSFEAISQLLQTFLVRIKVC